MTQLLLLSTVLTNSKSDSGSLWHVVLRHTKARDQYPAPFAFLSYMLWALMPIFTAVL
jgi:hypothetical protein